MIQLISGDDEVVEMPPFAARVCTMVYHALEEILDDVDVDNERNNNDYFRSHPIPVGRVKAKALRAIVEFCILYSQEKMVDIPDPLASSFDDPLAELVKPTFEENVPQPQFRNFVNEIGKDLQFFYEVRSAADFLDIKPVSANGSS